MKTALFLLSIAIAACSSSKTSKSTAGSTTGSGADSFPACIQKLIEEYGSAEKQNPPRSIYEYRYKGNTVYYVSAPCCDFFSDLYDSECKLIGHPDGGFTGRGDGLLPDFKDQKSGEKLIWRDERK